jgi:hypothetical protein
MKTPEKTPNVMEALDAGLAAAGTDTPSPEAPPADEAMPAGHEQLDSSDGLNTAAHWRFRGVAYSMTLLGLLLLPVMLLIRTGRWSMRNLVAHDRGWEFGPW